MLILESLVHAIIGAFPDDPTTPGVSVSFVNGKGWYVSACRYTDRFGKGKQVVAKAFGETLEQAATTAHSNFHGTRGAAT